jgi:hypothetical protein
MQASIQTATGREFHHSINPALAGFDRALRRSHDSLDRGRLDIDSEREVFLNRARAVVASTRIAWG